MLTALITMGAAGLLSDQEGPWGDEPDDRRRIELSDCTSSCEDRIRADIDRFAIDAGLAAPQWVRISYVNGLHAHTGVSDSTEHSDASGVTIFETTPLTSEFVEAVGLSANDVAFVESGGVLVDSKLVSVVHSFGNDDPVETRQVSLGGGVGVPGPVLIGGPNGSLNRTTKLLIFDEPVPGSLARQIEDLTDELGVFPSTLRDGPQLTAMTLAVAGAAVLFSLALAAANIAARELDNDIAIQTSLGAAPSFRPRLLATQTAIQLFIGIALGAPIGAALFFLVTRGDPTVPDAIIPLEEIGVLAVAAVAATVAVFSMHRPATPAVSSRVSIAPGHG